jgi:tetratricopeptide (TPR) repeat protein
VLAESAAELDHIAPERRAHPNVLRIRWGIGQASKQWNEAERVARELIGIVPNEFDGHWMLSFALHEMKRTQEACDNLARVREQFSGEYLLHYNLGCYLAQLGRLDDARGSLRAAFALNPQMRATAANDPDLEALRGEIKQMK